MTPSTGTVAAAAPAPRDGGRGPYAKSERRRRQILEAAIVEFGDHGYAGGSVARIASALSLSVAGVMHHFGGKESLLHAVLAHVESEVPDRFEHDLEAHGFAVAVLRLAECAAGRREVLKLIAVLGVEAAVPVHAAHQWLSVREAATRQRLAAGIRRDQERGRIDPSCPADLAAASVLAAWGGVRLLCLLDPQADALAVFGHCVTALVPSA
ncbi:MULTISPECIES: TetR/AcrR family transcriptional regulator [unclassified Rathayibacter]|uniref:TetR/AcrR family transcriptional regulator n=1 Tax=unclassified Rathayibacter TaxID=2609250 RepID=UPI0013598C15|nr:MULTISPECIES: TetR/AcrR family transcriptional regulator [unclassified Rathayibacter]